MKNSVGISAQHAPLLCQLATHSERTGKIVIGLSLLLNKVVAPQEAAL